MRLPPLSRFVVVTLATMLAGCARWHPVDPAAHPVLQQRDVLEFDFVGETVRLHAARFEQDSVTGVPWLRHPSCDSCRTSYALSRVVHPRVGRPERNIWLFLGPLAGAFSLLLAYALTYHGL